MGKMKWSLGPDDINDDAAGEGFEPYTGELPTRGLYRLRIARATAETSSNNNPMMVLMLLIDHEEDDPRSAFNGCPIWERVVSTPKAAFKVAQFRQAIGVTEADFINKTLLDDDENVTKIGRVKIPGAHVFAMVKKENDAEYGERAVIDRFLPPKDEYNEAGAGDDAEDDGDADAVEDDGAMTDDAWTREDLEALDTDSLKEILDGAEIEYDADEEDDEVLIALILGEEPVEEAAEEAEPEEAADDGEASEEWTREELEELDKDGLTEILDAAEVEYDADREDLPYYVALALGEDPPAKPRPKPAAKKAPAKKTAPAKKATPAKRAAPAKKTAAAKKAPF